MALAISSSSTVTMSSTYFATTGSVRAPARRTAMPSAMVTAGGSVTGACSASARFIDGSARGLHADDADARVDLLHRHGDAADEPAAADGHDHRLEVRVLLEQLEPDRALPRHDRVVVEGVDEGEPLRLAQRRHASSNASS